MSTQSKQLKIILAVDDTTLRGQLTKSLTHDNFTLSVIDSSTLRHFSISDTDFILLETNDDIAALVQTVYELYKRTGANYTLPIMAIASDTVINHNPAVALWLIDNHAAVICLVPREAIDFKQLPTQLKLLTSDEHLT